RLPILLVRCQQMKMERRLSKWQLITLRLCAHSSHTAAEDVDCHNLGIMVDFLSTPVFSSSLYILVPQLLVAHSIGAAGESPPSLLPSPHCCPFPHSGSSSHVGAQQSGAGGCCESSWEAGRLLSFSSAAQCSLLCGCLKACWLRGRREGSLERSSHCFWWHCRLLRDGLQPQPMCQCSCAVRAGCPPAWAVVTAGFGTSFPDTAGVIRISECTHLIKLATSSNSFGDLPKHFTSLLHVARQKLFCLFLVQVINAALALAARPKSQVVKSNMEMYRSTWENHIRVLTEAVDDITSIDDFLAVSESHILEDVNRCIVALREQDAEGLERAAGAVRGRAARLAHTVAGDMDSYEPGAYTQRVLGLVRHLSGAVIPEFINQVNIALESLSKSTVHVFDDNQFVDVSKKVYDTIHNIRCSVMMVRTPEELQEQSDLEDEAEARSRASAQSEGRTDRAKMTQLPEAEKEKIAEQVADFKKVKSKLDAEIEIWDDTSNDIIVLAKRMCVIMMEMTDFTRGRGPLKQTCDVINAAKMISESGSRMDVLARLIAEQCPDQSCKQDLLAYLEQIKLYSHQLKICSQVKAEIQNLGGELIMSALDSVTSLIQAAKNLMNSVVQTVKMSYIASTKIIKIQSPTGPRHPVVMWRMKAPEKKPLVKREKPEEIYAAVRKGSAKKRIHPVQVMSEFRGREV
ncbi:CTNA3 protein, partial [Oenanthe oenanthe]|nr:CTNA3 protein [Oenanthe oenanthe]